MELIIDKIFCRDISHMKTKERQSYVIPRTTYSTLIKTEIRPFPNELPIDDVTK